MPPTPETPDPRLALAKRLQEAMDELDVNQADLADEAHVSRGQISHLVKGDRGKEIGADALFKIAKALRVRPEWLLYGTGPRSGPEVPPLLRHRSEWPAIVEAVRQQTRISEEDLEVAGGWPDLYVTQVIDVDFVVDVVRAAEDLRRRAARSR